MRYRSAVVGLVMVLVISLAYGYGLGVATDGPMNTSCIGSAAMAAMGVFVLGVLVGAIILPVVSLLYIWRATSLSAETGAVGCPLVTILAALAAVGGFVLFQAQPLVHWVPPC